VGERKLTSRYLAPVYGIPENFDPTIFVGATMESVSFGWYVVGLTFSADTTIHVTVEGGYDHAGPNGAWHDEARDLPLSESRLMNLPGKEVTEAVVENPQALLLTFADGQTLRILDTSQQYESFQISRGQDFWVI
jgi:hypothetical protein